MEVTEAIEVAGILMVKSAEKMIVAQFELGLGFGTVGCLLDYSDWIVPVDLTD